jgi:RNA-directed DNA polymerase
MSQRNTDSTQRLADVYTKLRHISAKAKTEPGLRFTSLAHLLTIDLLDDSFQRLKRKAAAGVDGMTWREYECGLVPRLEDLHCRLKAGQYRAQPVRRVYIEKEGGKRRPLGIPATEDKVVQRATVTILEAIYEQEFYP